jgi:rubrerythrin
MAEAVTILPPEELLQLQKTVAQMVKDDRKAWEIATVIFAYQMTKEDDATDLTEIQTIALAVLKSINFKLNSPFLKEFIKAVIRFRKSLSRKSRKEIVEMFKTIESDEKGKIDKFKSMFGMGES